MNNASLTLFSDGTAFFSAETTSSHAGDYFVVHDIFLEDEHGLDLIADVGGFNCTTVVNPGTFYWTGSTQYFPGYIYGYATNAQMRCSC